MEILRQYQADVMLVLSGICGVISLFVYMTSSMSKRRKSILIQMEISAMFLLIADRRAYIFRGGYEQARLVDGAHQQFHGILPDAGGHLLL